MALKDSAAILVDVNGFFESVKDDVVLFVKLSKYAETFVKELVDVPANDIDEYTDFENGAMKTVEMLDKAEMEDDSEEEESGDETTSRPKTPSDDAHNGDPATWSPPLSFLKARGDSPLKRQASPGPKPP